MTKVIYEVEMTPANAPKIDAVNRILLGEDYIAEAPKTKPAEKAAPKAKKEAVEETGTTLDELKKAAKKSKAEHGEDFTMQVLKDAGIEVAATLGRSISKIPVEAYDSIIQDWADGPKVTEQTSDEPEDDGLDEDDGFGDEENTSEVTAEAVKTALKAYAKEVGRDEAKEIMQKHGASALSKINECTPKQLSAMFAELV